MPLADILQAKQCLSLLRADIYVHSAQLLRRSLSSIATFPLNRLPEVSRRMLLVMPKPVSSRPMSAASAVNSAPVERIVVVVLC